MKRILIAAAVTTGLLFGATANAAEKPGQWYITPMASAIWVDDDRRTDDDVGAALSIGRAISDSVNVEFHAFGYELEGLDDTDFWGVGGDILKVFYRADRISPYLLGGAGMSKKNSIFGPDDSDVYANVAFGLLTDLTSSGSVALRTELRYRYEFATPEGSNTRDGFRDLMFKVGLQIPFGRPYAEPVMAAAPVAAAAPPPPPPPPPPADTDGDGVPDTIDRCPTTPAGVRVDSYGCNCEYTLSLGFAFGSAELTPADRAALDELIPVLRNLPQVRGVIEGHTDSVGPEAFNQQLSERRAASVVDYLHNAGIGDVRFTAKGFGESKPIASNDTDEGRAANRRVVISRTDCS